MVGTSGNVVEQETISTRGFPSGNEVTFLVKVKAAGKQPNLLFFESIKIKPQDVKGNLAVQLLGRLVLTQNPTKLCMDGMYIFLAFLKLVGKLANKRRARSM